jgi:hypothetical protein
MRYLAILLAAAASLSACSSGSSGTGTETGEPRPDQSLITAEEIAEARVHNAYEAVQALRPQWLTPRASRTLANSTPRVPAVFLDRMELGPLASMRGVAVTNILEIRYHDERQAMNRFGIKYDTGIIQIITR